jgi:hypothetical protein
MVKLEDIRRCHVCGGYNFTPCSHVPIPDFYTDEDIYRDVLICNDCDTIHYIESGEVSYEFSCKINSNIGKKIYKENE